MFVVPAACFLSAGLLPLFASDFPRSALPHQVVIPPVENLLCQSAFCCGYYGCSCRPSDEPLGLTGERTMPCYQGHLKP